MTVLLSTALARCAVSIPSNNTCACVSSLGSVCNNPCMHHDVFSPTPSREQPCCMCSMHSKPAFRLARELLASSLASLANLCTRMQGHARLLPRCRRAQRRRACRFALVICHGNGSSRLCYIRSASCILAVDGIASRLRYCMPPHRGMDLATPVVFGNIKLVKCGSSAPTTTCLAGQFPHWMPTSIPKVSSK